MKHHTQIHGSAAGWFDDESGSAGAVSLKREHRDASKALDTLIRNNIDGSNDTKIEQARDEIADIERRILEFART